MSKGFASSYRLILVAAFVFAGFGAVAARLVWLQENDRPQLLSYVQKARREVIVTNARRGDILDANGNLLATSIAFRDMGVDPRSVLPEDEPKWPRLAALLGRPLPEVRRILTTRFAPLAAPARPPEGVGTTGSPRPPGAGLVLPLRAAPPGGQAADDDSLKLDDPDEQGNRPIKWADFSGKRGSQLLVSETTYDAIMKLGVRGVYGTRVFRRQYPDGSLAAHVIGYVNEDEKPVSGIESYADFYLRGQNGWIETEKDRYGHELAQFRSREVPATDGFTVKLSIDATVQQIVENEVAAIVQRYQPEKVTIIVGRPKTGFILALANYPSFNLNRYSEAARKDHGAALRNIAGTDEYEPGSVFKIVAASGALNDHLVTPSTVFDCSLTQIEYHGLVRKLPREMSTDHFKNLTVAQILDRSSNKGAAQLGMMLGENRYYSYVRAFGFGEPTGFPISGEREIGGDVPPVSRWDGLTITRMPMGQSVAVTALQVQQAMGVIASGGLLMRPQVITQVLDSNGALVYSFHPDTVRRVLSESTAQTVAKILEGVATKSVGSSEGGTADRAAIPGYEVAGKTGTGQKLEPVRLPSGRTVLRYADDHHVASFVGFFPASNPQVAISVIVNDADAHAPRGQYTGGYVAAPSFKRIGEQLIPYLDIRPPADTTARPLLALGAAVGGRKAR